MKYRPQVKAQVGRCYAQPLQFDLLEPIPVIQRQFDGLLTDPWAQKQAMAKSYYWIELLERQHPLFRELRERR